MLLKLIFMFCVNDSCAADVPETWKLEPLNHAAVQQDVRACERRASKYREVRSYPKYVKVTVFCRIEV